jgi:hypothetical protein
MKTHWRLVRKSQDTGRRRRHIVVTGFVVPATIALGVPGMLLDTSAAHADVTAIPPQTPVTFGCNDGTASYVYNVPAGINYLTVEAAGGSGETPSGLTLASGAGGLGGAIVGVVQVTPGQRLNATIGCSGNDDNSESDSTGADGYASGGPEGSLGAFRAGVGGGSTALSSSDGAIVVAGGGGGGGAGGLVSDGTKGVGGLGGNGGCSLPNGTSGTATSNPFGSTGGSGGAGGGAADAYGTAGGSVPTASVSGVGGGGGGGANATAPGGTGGGQGTGGGGGGGGGGGASYWGSMVFQHSCLDGTNAGDGWLTIFATSSIPTFFTCDSGIPVSSYTVPAGVTGLDVYAAGAQGATPQGFTEPATGVKDGTVGGGAPGGALAALVTVPGGTQLTTVSGCQGQSNTGPAFGAGYGGAGGTEPGTNGGGGGGGGGGTALIDSSNDAVMIAGGGGGVGDGGSGFGGGNGGSGGCTPSGLASRVTAVTWGREAAAVPSPAVTAVPEVAAVPTQTMAASSVPVVVVVAPWVAVVVVKGPGPAAPAAVAAASLPTQVRP